MQKIENCPTHCHIFSEGSKNNHKTGFVAILNKKAQNQTRNKDTSIFSAMALVMNLRLPYRKTIKRT